MDWFTWLSKSNLDPSLVYDYALTFTHNELVEDDVVYFSHEFLQSMGVSVAKHRLEILKVARRNSLSRRTHPVLWITLFFNRTKNFVAKRLQALARRGDPPLSLVPMRNCSLRWKVAMLQRNKRLRSAANWPVLGGDGDGPMFVSGSGVLMLTNGSSGSGSGSGSTRSSSWVDSDGDAEFAVDAVTNTWINSKEDVKWDSMFKNLNPT